MLAVFDKSVAQCPQDLKTSSPDDVYALKDGNLAKYFSSLNENAMIVNLGSPGFVAYANDKQNPLLPRLFAVVDNILCLFLGHVENLSTLKQQYRMSKSDNEVNVIIEAYRTLRDRGPYPIEQVIRDLQGKFAFVVYDLASKTSVFATDADGSVPFFWGADSDGHLVVSDDVEIVKKGCGKSFAPFPKGCFYTSSGGLRSYEHPGKELKPVPRVDSSGEVCGSNFKVDSKAKKEPLGMPRVDSAADWSSGY